MMPLTHEVTSEIAYDLMHDHLDTILELLEGPMPRQDVVQRVGSDKVLDRMVRYGLVEADGNTLQAVSTVYHKLRQESMMSFLEHYVLPSVTAGVEEQGFAALYPRYLKVDEQTITSMRQGPVQGLFDRLVDISEQPSDGVRARLTVMVIGTSTVDGEADIGDDEQALRHLKAASIQRATEGERDRAVLSQYVFLADNARYLAAADAVDEFVSSLASQRANSPSEATYHLTVASHWRCATPGVSEGSQQ